MAQFVRILLPPSHWPFMVPIALSASCKKTTARKIKIFYFNLSRDNALGFTDYRRTCVNASCLKLVSSEITRCEYVLIVVAWNLAEILRLEFRELDESFSCSSAETFDPSLHKDLSIPQISSLKPVLIVITSSLFHVGLLDLCSELNARF